MKVEMLKKTKENHSMRPTRQIALSFFMVILIGSILLTLPISNNGETTSCLLYTSIQKKESEKSNAIVSFHGEMF